MSAANTLTPSPNVLAVGSRHQPQYYVSDTDGSDDDILPTSSRVLWKKARMNARAATAASGSDHPSSSTEEKLQDRKSCKAASQCRYYQRNKARHQESARLRAASKRRHSSKSDPTRPNSDTFIFYHNLDVHLPSITADQSTANSTLNASPLVAAVLPPVHKTCANPQPPDELIEEWSHWSARDRVVGLRRWMLDLEWSLGALDGWTLEFMQEWPQKKQQSHSNVAAWLEINSNKVSMGRLILGYLGRVMDGRLSGDLAECRDLALQTYQLGSALYSAVIGLEVSLRWARSSLE